MERKRRKSEQFQDWIVGMYPELQTGSEDVEEMRYRVLSRTFTFQVTDACNLACTYCYQINKKTRRMSFETAKVAVDKLLTGADGFGDYVNPSISPAIVLDFIGGEPFLEIELIDKVVDYFREKAIELEHPWADKFMISICSNGVLYKDPRVQRFLLKNHNILSFSVTVDGTQELHDACRVFPDGSPSYYLAHAAALDWMNRGYYMGSKITIAPGNVTYLADSLLAMVEDNYHDINANCVYEEGWTLEHATELYKQCKKFADNFHAKYDLADYSFSLLNDFHCSPLSSKENSNWCGGTGSMLAVDPDGNLFPCLRYMESSIGDIREPLIIGNVFDGLMKKQCHKDCMDCMNRITRRSQSTDQCFYCPIASGCAWCSAYNYQVFGTVDKRATFICEMHKARSLATVYFHNMYHKKVNDGKVKDLWVSRQWAVPIIGEEEYEKLVELTKSLGGYVNEDISMLNIGERHIGELRKEDYENIEVLSRD